jgi:hypothetical protein
MAMKPDVVTTQWGFITPAAMWRLQSAYDVAVAAKQPGFELDGNQFSTAFVKHLLDYCRQEGMEPEKGGDEEPIFQQSVAVGRDHKPLVALIQAHLNEIDGAMIASDGDIIMFKDKKAIASITWPEIMGDIEALARKPS